MNPTRIAVVAFAALTGCASATRLPEADRLSLPKAFEGKLYYLRSSLNVMPFFADDSKRLVSPLPADSILLLQDSQGAPISPGAVESVLPMGSKVRVEKVELPTGLVVARRPLYTPRESPWVYLSLAGKPHGRPFVAVLRPGIASREEMLAALKDILSEDEPSLWLKNVAPEIRRAIEEKRLVAGMDADCVALAWGRPERIRHEVEAGVRVETWTWQLGKRTATLRDGKLSAATPTMTP